MVSNFPRLFVAPDETSSRSDVPAADGIGDRVLDRVREAFCGLHGHDSMLQFHHDRLFLKCVSCGHESPGWSLTEKPPKVVARADSRRQALDPQLISVRRIA